MSRMIAFALAIRFCPVVVNVTIFAILAFWRNPMKIRRCKNLAMPAVGSTTKTLTRFRFMIQSNIAVVALATIRENPRNLPRIAIAVVIVGADDDSLP